MPRFRCTDRFGARESILCAAMLLAISGCNQSGSAIASAGASGAPNLSISGTPMMQVGVGQSYTFTPATSIATATGLTFSIQNKPAWASFSVSSGELAGTPTTSDVGTYTNVIISASDGSGTAALPSFTITVEGGGGTATLSWQAPTTNTNGSPLSDLAGYTIRYGQNVSGLSQSVQIADPSNTSYTVDNLSSGTWYFAVSADASDGSESSLSDVVSDTIP